MKVLKIVGVMLLLTLVVTGYRGISKISDREMNQENMAQEVSHRGNKDIESNLSTPKKDEGGTPKNNLKDLHDDNYKKLLRSGAFQEAISHLIKKSEEHIGGQPSREDFITKLDVMSQYIDYDSSILERDFDFFISYYSLNAYDRREDRMGEMEKLLEDTYKTHSEKTRYCMGFFRESGRRNVNYSKLASSVMDCAANENKRSIVFDYVNFLKESKSENYAMQEYTKLRLLHNELPEYGEVYQNY